MRDEEGTAVPQPEQITHANIDEWGPNSCEQQGSNDYILSGQLNQIGHLLVDIRDAHNKLLEIFEEEDEVEEC